MNIAPFLNLKMQPLLYWFLYLVFSDFVRFVSWHHPFIFNNSVQIISTILIVNFFFLLFLHSHQFPFHLSTGCDLWKAKHIFVITVGSTTVFFIWFALSLSNPKASFVSSKTLSSMFPLPYFFNRTYATSFSSWLYSPPLSWLHHSFHSQGLITSIWSFFFLYYSQNPLSFSSSSTISSKPFSFVSSSYPSRQVWTENHVQ